jgi:hypothetical protein
MQGASVGEKRDTGRVESAQNIGGGSVPLAACAVE